LPPFIHNVAEFNSARSLSRPAIWQGQACRDFSLSLAQALFQVIGITSIFPFLAIAADPERIRRSHFGTEFLSLFPRWKTGNSFWSPG